MLSRASLFRRTPQSITFRRNYFQAKFPRDERFSKLTGDDVNFFKGVLGPSGVITAEEDADGVASYNTDWMKKYKGNGSLVLRPKTTEQVSEILKYANERKLAIVPQGGNTGLVGGSVPVFDEVVLSTALMSHIEEFDDVSGVVTCQAGVVLGNLESFLHPKGYTVPLDLGAKGSCHIGGNVATNAGGLRLLRYGSLHGNVLGVEAVLADGTIIDCASTLRKDNTGYDIKQLFIGSEGTLGIITKVVLLTPPKPQAVNVAFFGLRTFEDVKKLFTRTKQELGEILSAFEFVDRGSIELVVKHSKTGARDPFGDAYPFYVLIETSGSSKEHDEEKLNTFLEKLLGEEDSLICDGTVAQQTSQIQSLWSLRESVPESLQREGAVYKYDISIPLNKFYEIVEIMRERIGDKGNVVGYGHIGDSNLHLNISSPKFDPEVYSLIEPYVYEYTSKQRGSVSAEHGIGVMKPHVLHCSKSHAAIQLMKNVKKAMDPNGILNPYKVLPTHEEEKIN
ncbi:hypothetical protein PROFUN_11031 [Planoprotostelium fungivorum]|uniref:FAD-binding PCMH-type domain-containing protein n=1 Tax=Planoprotostelium fungivorum TaxID=1890364 RepID=A0A2P6NBT7_9EUKA|nr:hypothetical protein PROFUN_11031 [Planoprotostelium fungivorum]